MKTKHHPEKKIGPFAGGIGVAIWLNDIETETGSRKMRSLTISPRRYRDPETGEWKDAPSFNVGDLPALIFALTKAQEFCFTQPIPGNRQDEGDDREVAF